MTLEYVLLLVATVALCFRFMVDAPKTAFRDSAPRLGARIERHLATGTGFTSSGSQKAKFRWDAEPRQ